MFRVMTPFTILKNPVFRIFPFTTKITLNFYMTEDGIYKDYDEVLHLLQGMDDISFLSGGYHNLEITKKGVTKGKSLQILTEMLGIDMKETMACGDSENDIPEGTLFEKLPEEWICPDCGESKEMFIPA